MAVYKENDIIPDFSLKDHTGKVRKLSEFADSYTVLYFYPKDDTKGCNQEAAGFKALYSEFRKHGMHIVGISVDPPESHKKYVKKYDFPFTLLSDEERKIVEDFGIWVPKKFMGREYMGTERVTYVLDAARKVIRFYPKVDTETHAGKVFEDITGKPAPAIDLSCEL